MTAIIKHEGAFPSCQFEKIRELAESSDNEYYIAGTTKNIDRINRGVVRIEHILNELENLLNVIKCQTCNTEINQQLALQKEGLEELRFRLKDLEL